jgi:hypothetical protein
VEEEYCWAITGGGAVIGCGRSVPIVLDFGFQLDCLEYMDDNAYVQWQLARNSICAGPFDP